MIATSVKTDLLRDTIAARQQRGQVFVYDPTDTTSYQGATWSPLAYCSDWRGAQRTPVGSPRRLGPRARD